MKGKSQEVKPVAVPPYRAVLKRFDGDAKAELWLSFPPYVGLHLQAEWRDGDYVEIESVFWDEQLGAFEAFAKEQQGDAPLPKPGEALQLIEAKRKRQIEKEGFDHSHDDQYDGGELAAAAACYAASAAAKRGGFFEARYSSAVTALLWPFAPEWWKPKTTLNDLVRAGALIAAEIDHLLTHPED